MQDKVSLGVTLPQKDFLEVIVDDLGIFEKNMDAAKFAMALALRRGLTPDDAKGAVTAWSVSSFDPDGSVKALVSALYPDVTAPYHYVEALIMAGLEIMQKEFDTSSDVDIERLIRWAPEPANAEG